MNQFLLKRKRISVAKNSKRKRRKFAKTALIIGVRLNLF